MRLIAWLVLKGRRPRLQRNRINGIHDHDQSVGVIALNRIHLGSTDDSHVDIPVLGGSLPDKLVLDRTVQSRSVPMH